MASPLRAGVPLVDARAVRVSQAFTAALVLVPELLGAWPLLVPALLHLLAAVALGARGNLPIRAFQAVVSPRLAAPELEDARPPRFANVVGAAFVAAALVAHASAAPGAGRALSLAVGGLALLGAATGICVGCGIYRLVAPLRGVRRGAPRQFDLEELGAPAGAPEVVVEFTHPLCFDCQRLDRRLAAEGAAVVRVDVSARPELARKYGVLLVPLAYAVAPDGTVLRRVA